VRELEEETGYKTKNIVNLDPFVQRQVLHGDSAYLSCKRFNSRNHNRGSEHGMEIFELTLDEIDSKILSGEIIDAKSICGVQLFKLQSQLNK